MFKADRLKAATFPNQATRLRQLTATGRVRLLQIPKNAGTKLGNLLAVCEQLPKGAEWLGSLMHNGDEYLLIGGLCFESLPRETPLEHMLLNGIDFNRMPIDAGWN
jgi:hypothetical protein